jgi:hypothetical protein
MTSLEQHPYIKKHFDDSKIYKYLIIGTFPPNKEIREEDKSWADFFYGNKGTLWKIVEGIYPKYKFTKVKKEERVRLINEWKNEYSIGITDTILECCRTDIKSTDDKDLIIDWEGYNHSLKTYVLKNINSIEKLIFTSNKGCNSALETFKIIMGEDYKHLRKEKLEGTMPSPSGSSNTSMFNVNKEESLGLLPDLHSYITTQRNDLLASFKTRWEIKKKKLNSTKEEKKLIEIPKSHKGILVDYKIWKYSQVLPKAN